MVNYLGGRIKQIRKMLDLNQEDFAVKLGFETPVAISYYENNKRTPDVSTLVKIAKLGNVSLDWLLTGEGEMYANAPTSPSKSEYGVQDSELEEIIEWLKENPQDKKLFLKILNGKKDIKEATEVLLGFKSVLAEKSI